jgi:hypothetical protein
MPTSSSEGLGIMIRNRLLTFAPKDGSGTLATHLGPRLWRDAPPDNAQ